MNYYIIKFIIKFGISSYSMIIQTNKESLDILLKYDIVSVNSVKELIDSKKLEITDVFEVISKYERNDE